MKAAILILLGGVALAGCMEAPKETATPVVEDQELQRLSDVDLAEDAPKSGFTPDQAAPKGGLLSLFRAAAAPADPSAEAPSPADVADLPAKEDAADPEVKLVSADPEATPVKTGLFGRKKASAAKPSVAPGTVLPFGEVATACGIRGKALGKEVDRFPAKGKGYRIYDTNPTTTAPRTHFVTGFSEGCPRQFTAALALIGSPVLHETRRYDKSSAFLPVSALDKAYERVKRSVCKVGRNKPCPQNRVSALEKSTSFVTAYQRFGTSGRWVEILIHDREITISGLRSN